MSDWCSTRRTTSATDKPCRLRRAAEPPIRLLGNSASFVHACKIRVVKRYSMLERTKTTDQRTIMKTSNRTTRLVGDLAAHWTEPVLRLLKEAGKGHLSVQSEVETWQTLNDVLRTELRWQRVFRSARTSSLSMVMEQVLRRTLLVLARRYNLSPALHELEKRIRRMIRDRRSNVAEGRLFGELLGQP